MLMILLFSLARIGQKMDSASNKKTARKRSLLRQMT
jgi:hypothetical protein